MENVAFTPAMPCLQKSHCNQTETTEAREVYCILRDGTGRYRRDLAIQGLRNGGHPGKTLRKSQFSLSSLCAFRGLLAAFPKGKSKREGPKVEGAAFSGAELEDLAEI